MRTIWIVITYAVAVVAVECLEAVLEAEQKKEGKQLAKKNKSTDE